MKENDTLVVLAGNGGRADHLLSTQPRAPYNADEQRLSVDIERDIDRLIQGGEDHLVLLKMYPRRAVEPAASAIRPEIAERIAADALNVFGPLHGGVVTQEALDDVIVQGRRYSTAYPHINLNRYDFYDAASGEPLLGVWRASRIQNLRRETRTNRTIDVALLVLEVSKSVFPMLHF